jgi:hypothetical protein
MSTTSDSITDSARASHSNLLNRGDTIARNWGLDGDIISAFPEDMVAQTWRRVFQSDLAHALCRLSRRFSCSFNTAIHLLREKIDEGVSSGRITGKAEPQFMTASDVGAAYDDLQAVAHREEAIDRITTALKISNPEDVIPVWLRPERNSHNFRASHTGA